MARVFAIIGVVTFIVDVTNAIGGGDPSRTDSYPYMGSLQCPQIKAGHICNTFLLKMDTVITAAHCVSHDPADPPVRIDLLQFRMFVVMGANDVLSTDPEKTRTRQERELIQIIWHPNFEFTKDELLLAKFDIAAAILKTPFIRDLFVTTIDMLLPFQRFRDYMEAPNTICYIAGWGTQNVPKDKNATLPESATLNEAKFEIANKYMCCHWRTSTLQYEPCMKMLGYTTSGTSCFHSPQSLEVTGRYSSVGVGDEGAPVLCALPGCPNTFRGCLAGMVVGGMVTLNKWAVRVLNPGFRVMEGTIQQFILSVVGHPYGLMGRTAVQFYEHPYLGSLNTRDANAMTEGLQQTTHVCNVVFVALKAAITAAHCIIVDLCTKPMVLIPAGTSKYYVTTGFSWKFTVQRSDVKTSVLHKNSSITLNRPFYNHYDIGAVIVETAFKYGNDFSPIFLDSSVAEYIKGSVLPHSFYECEFPSWAASVDAYFGTITDSLHDPDTLSVVAVALLSNKTCCEIFFDLLLVQCLNYFRTSGHECHNMEPTREPFLGDTGAPLVCYYKMKKAVMGIVVGAFTSSRCTNSTSIPFCREYKVIGAHVDYYTMSEFITNSVLKLPEVAGHQPKTVGLLILVVITTVVHFQIE